MQEEPAPQPRKRRRGNRQLQGLRRLQREEQKAEALKLMKAGHTYAQIAAKLKVSANTVAQWVRGKLQAMADASDETTRELAELQYARCEEIIHSLYSEKNVARVSEVLLKVMDRQARLKGFDRPVETRHTISVEQMSREELVAEAKKLGIVIEDAEYTLLSTPQELPGLLEHATSEIPAPAPAFLEVTPVVENTETLLPPAPGF